MPSRILVGIIGLPITIACLITGGLPTAAFLLVVIVVCAYEMHKITALAGYNLSLPLMVAGSISFLFDAVIAGGKYVGLILIIVLIINSFLIIGKDVYERALEKNAIMLFAVIYCGWSMSKFYFLREMSFKIAFTTLAIVWLCDIFALSSGRIFGRNKLSPNISPGKTVEGSIGGVVGTLIFMIAAKLIGEHTGLFTLWSIPAIVLMTVSFTLIGQIGDLFESALKRWVGVKDSSSILLSHGGMLDRFDSFIFAVPFAYYVFLLIM